MYLLLISLFVIGWRRTTEFVSTSKNDIYKRVSVVVAIRNEEIFLPGLIRSLQVQNYKNFELVLVNDHSTDTTRMIMEEALHYFQNIQLIDAIGIGKKNALKEGILKAKSELIITTDADCIPLSSWIETILNFSNQFSFDLLICPVKYSDRKSLFAKLQQLEFTSLVASGVGAAGSGRPIMCNAANLAFTKKAWLESQKDLHAEEQSGDDIFLLQSIKKRKGIVRFLRSEFAFVETRPSETVKSFIKQRRRWASKSTSYADWHIIITAVLILSASLLDLFLMVYSIFNPQYFILLLLFFCFKYLLDTLLLINVRHFFKLKKIFLMSLILSVIYPFYIVFVGVSSIITKPKNW